MSKEMMDLRLDNILEVIEADLTMGIYDPFLILGKPGVGKTVGTRNLANKLGIGYKEMRLSTMTETDIVGIPTIDEHGMTKFLGNSILPVADRDGEVGILVIDEITSAAKNVRAAAYQLLDSSRSAGNYKLPEKWKVVALGNGEEDGGIFDGFEAATSTRFMSYRVEINVEAWKKWASHNNIHTTILAFISSRPEYLHTYEPDSTSEKYACPRNWEFLSKRLNGLEKMRGKQLDADTVEIYAAGAVELQVATEFATFYSYKNSLLDVSKILNGDTNIELTNIKTESILIAIQSLVREAVNILNKNEDMGYEDTDEFNKICNIIKFTVHLSNYRIDYGLQLIQDIALASKTFRNLVVDDIDGVIDRKCDGWLAFIERANIVL